MWLPLARPLLGTWPATQACALTRNRTSNPWVSRLALHPLSHTSQGLFFLSKNVLALQGPLKFYEFQDGFSYICKEVMVFGRNCFEDADRFGQQRHQNGHGMCFYLFVSFSFLSAVFYSFYSKSFTSWVSCKVFYSFWCCCKKRIRFMLHIFYHDLK